MKTINELAKQYKVSTQSIYQKIKRLGDGVKPHVFKDDKGGTLVDEQGENILFNEENTANKEVANQVASDVEHIKDLQTVIELLTTQLQTKDKQIESMQQLLSQTHAILAL